ncbi:N-acetyl-gamma-glutamyl-phosphate reductase [Deinococcus yavapaiensis]|uniref:N-acetyl-gamma-glutamyl-phosphate reductase n=1 Tax=Deinococcus yavapaiensis KR-236 TaxID=694435 RepID=A0A318S4L7_9DEIO|nr:N-acetyl-gamma-glutamyl-phosphate reductase [Deinococcus yavapaiensis]PYE53376.1 N-acetyl-gamma-glutamyl-phosphate reductase [Deinococcus yavapaiensis KR-236]
MTLPAKPRIFIDGEAGTTGLQIRARLAERTDLELVSIDAEKRKDDAERARLLNSVDVAILCLPDEASRQAVAMIENDRVRVLDASSAHRVEPGWTYGFPELSTAQEAAIRTSTRVSVPGCYPTGMIGLVRPLVDARLLASDYPVSVHGASGYSGGGRTLVDAMEGRGGAHKLAGPYRAYGLTLDHKHVPEMRTYGGLAHAPLFTPSVGAWRQGMLVEVPLHTRLLGGATGRDLHEALRAHYEASRFVDVMEFGDGSPDVLDPETLAGTNRMELFVFENPAQGHVLLMARFDNLGKGASGAAVQNLDLMLGLDAERDYAVREEVTA